VRIRAATTSSWLNPSGPRLNGAERRGIALSSEAH